MDSSAARTVRMYSCISPPFRPADSGACKKVSKYSLTWSKAPRAGRQRTSRASKNRFRVTIRNEGGQQWPPLVFGADVTACQWDPDYFLLETNLNWINSASIVPSTALEARRSVTLNPGFTPL